MVYNIKKSDGSPLVSIPDSTQDTTTTSLTLPGRNAVNFGISINQNFINLLQNFAANTPPPVPLQGQLWYDSINMYLKVYDGKRWVEVMPAFDGSAGSTTVKIGPFNTDCTIFISQYQIVMVISADRVQRSDCPDSIVFNDTGYAFSSRFPNGLYPGVNLSTDPSGVVSYVVNGTSTHANVLANSRTIFINGSMMGQFEFDASSNVNVTVSDSNVYVVNSAGYTTNVTVGGTWTKVLVSDGGRILQGNNITRTDVVAALGYTPYDGGNIDITAVANTIVGRDSNASFAANVIVAQAVTANVFSGTASNAMTLRTARTVYVNGDMFGSVEFDGSTDVILNTNLVTSGVTAGTYNVVNVDDKGRVTNGSYDYQIPIGGIILFNELVIPAGWALCDGRTVTDPQQGSINTPNLVSSFVGPTRYIMRVFAVSPSIPAGTPGTGPIIVINGQPASQSVNPYVSSMLVGGPAKNQTTATFQDLTLATVGGQISNQQSAFSNTSFLDTEYFNMIALVMSIGDPNAIMFSQNDVWNNLSSLTLQDVIDNLTTRAGENLPAFVGKYMLPLKLMRQKQADIGIPGDMAFDALLQDQMMSAITSDFARQLTNSGITPTNDNLFACHYFGSVDAWKAVLRSQSNATISSTLHSSGFYTTATSMLENHTKDSIISIFGRIMQLAQAEIQHRKETGQNLITSGSYTTSDGANVIVTGEAVGGYKYGDDNFTDMHGGYFADYQNPTLRPVGSTSVGPALTPGSVGTVVFTLADAGACALAAILQSAVQDDQAGLCQLMVNRTGATADGTHDYGAANGFDTATLLGSFSAIDAALYGVDNNPEAYALYGQLFVNKAYLKSALGYVDPVQMKDSVAWLFQATLTLEQLDRLVTLRDQVYKNGAEMGMAQTAIGGAVNYLPPGNASSVVLYPFGPQANGYVTVTPLNGFYVPNTADATSMAPAPSPDALLNRLMSVLTIPTVTNTNTGNAEMITTNQSNAIIGANVTTSGNSSLPEVSTIISDSPEQPVSGNVIGGKIIGVDLDDPRPSDGTGAPSGDGSIP